MEKLQAFAEANFVLVAIFLGLIVAFVINELRRSTRRWREIGSAELTRLINGGDTVVVDLRSLKEYEAGHILGARHIPPTKIDPESKELRNAKDKPLILYCQSGLSCAAVADRLTASGFEKVHVLKGGVPTWTGDQLPLHKPR